MRADPDSKVWPKATLGPTKVSYVVAHGLGPHYHEQIVRDVKKAFTYVFGVDGSTFKSGGGLDKHLDIWVRYFSETLQQVVDHYLDTHSFGHEKADQQVQNNYLL